MGLDPSHAQRIYKGQNSEKKPLQAITFDWSDLQTWFLHLWSTILMLFSGRSHLPTFCQVACVTSRHMSDVRHICHESSVMITMMMKFVLTMKMMMATEVAAHTGTGVTLHFELWPQPASSFVTIHNKKNQINIQALLEYLIPLFRQGGRLRQRQRQRKRHTQVSRVVTTHWHQG